MRIKAILKHFANIAISMASAVMILCAFGRFDLIQLDVIASIFASFCILAILYETKK
jgi:hypothetical protein